MGGAHSAAGWIHPSDLALMSGNILPSLRFILERSHPRFSAKKSKSNFFQLLSSRSNVIQPVDR